MKHMTFLAFSLKSKEHGSKKEFFIFVYFMYLCISGTKNVAISVLGKHTDFKITEVPVQF